MYLSKRWRLFLQRPEAEVIRHNDQDRKRQPQQGGRKPQFFLVMAFRSGCQWPGYDRPQEQV